MAKQRRLKVSKKMRRHILKGDQSGSGGHGPGRRKSGKSEFPATLSDQDIIEGIEAIANDPSLYPGRAIPKAGPPIKLIGLIKDVRTVVIADPANDGVRTAWPEDAKRNP
jgi:hypothetical protein